MKKLIERAAKNVKGEYKVRILIDPEEADILSSGVIPKNIKTNVYKSHLGIYIELIGKAEDVMRTEINIRKALIADYTKSGEKTTAKT